MTRVCVTVDAEPDCPPYLWGWRGMDEGAPLLLDLFARAGVPATFFTTGDAARHAPGFVRTLVEAGHELACHGMTHRAFPDLSAVEAEEEIDQSTRLLREFAPVDSFRAPYLRFPDAWLRFLEARGYRVDASLGRYKPSHWGPRATTSLHRVKASISSSWIRLPRLVRDPMLRGLRDPVVLFVHPWEFVDLRGTDLRWDCRAGTGPGALRALEETIGLLADRGGRFVTVRDLASGA